MTQTIELNKPDKGNCDVCLRAEVMGKHIGPYSFRTMVERGGNPLPPKPDLVEASIASGLECDWRLEWLKQRAESDITPWFLCDDCLGRLSGVVESLSEGESFVPKPVCSECRRPMKPTAQGTPDPRALRVYFQVLQAKASSLGPLMNAMDTAIGIDDPVVRFLGIQPKHCPICRVLWDNSCLGKAISKRYERAKPSNPQAYRQAYREMVRCVACPECTGKLEVVTTKFWNALSDEEREAAARIGRYQHNREV